MGFQKEEDMNHRLIHSDCLKWLRSQTSGGFQCIFADPPDNIGLKYHHSDDKMSSESYLAWIETCLKVFIYAAPIVWLSYNAKWQFHIGGIIARMLNECSWLEAKPCVQVFTFGQHNQRDLGNNHRPLVRLMQRGAPLYPDQIRVPSERQKTGDKRADPRGRVPGDVFESRLEWVESSVYDFPRVTGNSKQRRSYHPTQLNEGLVERCIKLSTLEGDRVLDLFAGTGTTLRVCKRINRPCTLIENSEEYCKEIAKEHELTVEAI